MREIGSGRLVVEGKRGNVPRKPVTVEQAIEVRDKKVRLVIGDGRERVYAASVKISIDHKSVMSKKSKSQGSLRKWQHPSLSPSSSGRVTCMTLASPSPNTAAMYPKSIGIFGVDLAGLYIGHHFTSLATPHM